MNQIPPDPHIREIVRITESLPINIILHKRKTIVTL